jgi:hypothetical protein
MNDGSISLDQVARELELGTDCTDGAAHCGLWIHNCDMIRPALIEIMMAFHNIVYLIISVFLTFRVFSVHIFKMIALSKVMHVYCVS